MSLRSLSVLFGLLLSLCGAAQAHHGAALFDTGTEVSIEGVVTRYGWKNPPTGLKCDLDVARRYLTE